MRLPGTTRSAGTVRSVPIGGLADHLCWAYSSKKERVEAVSAWLTGGIELGQRALYVACGSARDLEEELCAVPALRAALDEGLLVAVPSAELYDLSAPLDADAQLALYSFAVDQATAAGLRGLRVAADITPLVAAPARRHAHLCWEQLADRYMTGAALAPMCLYDTRRISDIDAIVCAHPLHGPAEAPFVICAVGPAKAALVGELDVTVAEVFAETLAGLPATDEALDVTGLTFIDGRAASVLHDELVRRQAAGQDLVLDGASPPVRRMWAICGFENSFLDTRVFG